ncbi:hypothetical protein [Ancylomarina sp.]|uniref:hypothetical protein n=1 Tax=Ancylomarina sp. TaxID=1970196 RepID=UPI0035644A8E
MKKLSYVFYLLLSILLFSCGGTSESDNKIEKERYQAEYDIQTIEHDSCEYIIYKEDKGVQMIHKQNCKFCERRQSNS